MLDLEEFDFSNMGLIFLLNSMPTYYGSFETTDSTALIMSRLEFGYMTEKFKLFTRSFTLQGLLIQIRVCEKVFQKIKD
jgi:predicted metalloprotease with PDZ domain